MNWCDGRAASVLCGLRRNRSQAEVALRRVPHGDRAFRSSLVLAADSRLLGHLEAYLGTEELSSQFSDISSQFSVATGCGWHGNARYA